MGTMVNSKTLLKGSNQIEVELLSDYLDGILDEESCQKIELQVKQDEYLAELLEGVRKLKTEENLSTIQLMEKLSLSAATSFQKHFGSPGKNARYTSEFQTPINPIDQINPDNPENPPGLPPYESKPQDLKKQ